MRHLSYSGIVPSLVIDLTATRDELMECFESCSGKENLPKFSKAFYEHILNEWNLTAAKFRNWFGREYQVTTEVPISESNWLVYKNTKQHTTSIFFEIKHYYKNVSKDWPLRVANMKISPLEFLERQSSFKTFCPCCLHFSNELESGGDPPDRTGVVQYRSYLYWLCNDHIELFLKAPEKYLPPYGTDPEPQEFPKKILTLRQLPENVAEGGLCVVCSKQSRRTNKGICSHAIEYNSKIFIFDTEKCANIFMRKPTEYIFSIKFHHQDNYSVMNYRDLPLLGMLEQYMAVPVMKALQSVATKRPLIPGLSVATTALIGIGLYLKLNHAKIPLEYKLRYSEGGDLFYKRGKCLLNSLDAMKNTINPYLHYEEPMPPFKILNSNSSERSESQHDEPSCVNFNI